MTLNASNALGGVRFGCSPGYMSSINGIALTANNHQIAFMFTPTKTTTVTKIWAAQGAGGTGVDMRWSICPDALGLPDTANRLIAETAFTSPGPSSSILFDISGSPLSVTSGVRYWLVIRNNTSTSVTISFSGATPHGTMNTAQRRDAGVGNWTAGGVTYGIGWGAREYGDGTVDGWPAITNSTIATYGTTLTGGRVTTPQNAYLNVAGIGAGISQVAGLSGTISFKLYKDFNLIGSTGGYTPPNANYPSYLTLLLTTPVLVAPNSDLCIMMTAPDGTVGVYATLYRALLETNSNNAEYLKLRPNGMRYVTYNGTTWTTTENYVPWIYLILDSENPFIPVGVSRARLVNAGGI